MRKKIENIIVAILVVLMLIILFGIIYFCLDVFEIIEVPSKYSIASLFESQIEVIATTGEVLNDVIPSEEVQRKINVVKSSDETEKQDRNIDEIEERLNKLEDERNQSNTYVEADSDEEVKKFYYNQLDDYAKIIYDKLDENLDKLKTGTYTFDYGLTFNQFLQDENNTETLNNSFQLAINALTFDNPDLFYIDVTKMYLLTEITTKTFSKTYKVSIGPKDGQTYLADNFSSAESVEYAIKSVEDKKNEIIDSLQENDIDKIKTIHDYLVDNNEYDAKAGSMIYSVYGALINEKSVCEGYARAFKYILDDVNIPCIIVCGIGQNGEGTTESHAWNYVKINGIWYAIDVTWDDPVITGNGSLTDDIKYSFFLKGYNTFSKNHFEDGNIVGNAEFKYPEISLEDYNL